jgi:hypothetical protein
VLLEKEGENQLDDSVKNGDVLHRVKEEMNILHSIQRRKANWNGHVLSRN